MHSSRMSLLLADLASAVTVANTSLAQSLKRQVGTQFTVTADPLVPRPAEQSCKVQLFSDYRHKRRDCSDDHDFAGIQAPGCEPRLHRRGRQRGRCQGHLEFQHRD